MEEKVDVIENAEDGKQYGVVYRNKRYEIDFFMSFIYIPPQMYRHNVGRFHMNKDKKICFEFSETCPQEIRDSMIEYYGNGTKGMLFTNELTGRQSETL